MGINLFELIGYYYPSDGENAATLLSMYYLFVVLMGSSMLGLTLTIVGSLSNVLKYLIIVTFLITATVFAVPHMAIDGVESVGYTSTRIPGPFYWVFQCQILGCVLGTISVLVYHLKANKNLTTRRKAKAMLIALSPILFVVVGVVVLMALGFRVTGSIVGSFAILTFLLTFLIIEHEYKLFRFLSFVPLTTEFKFVNGLREILSKSGVNSLQDSVAQFEHLLILNTIDQCDGNKTNAANTLGISRTTLRRKIQEGHN